MLKLFRNSKWEWVFYASLSTTIMIALLEFVLKSNVIIIPSGAELWLKWAPLLIAVRVMFAYRRGRRYQSRIDQMQVAMKQAAAGNWNARLPELGTDAYAEVYRDFNAMLEGLGGRLKLLQQLGERDVLEEASSQEEAVLEERRRLARDLHDTVSQQLFAIHMSASALPALLKKNVEHADQIMKQLIEMSSSAQRQMRGLIAQLRPLELQGRTLSEALDRWFPDYCRQNGIQGTLDIQLSGLLAEAIEHQLFLIIQEAMANVVKHSGAREVQLSLGDTDRQVTLGIDDDGSGFKAEQVRTGAYGLSTMRERAQQLGGEAEILTKSGSGTRVKVWLPKFESAASSSDTKESIE